MIKASFNIDQFKQNACWQNNDKFMIMESKVKSHSYYYPFTRLSNKMILNMLAEEERIEVFANEGIRVAIEMVWTKVSA